MSPSAAVAPRFRPAAKFKKQKKKPMKKANTVASRIVDVVRGKTQAIAMAGSLSVAGVLTTQAQTPSEINLGGYLPVNVRRGRPIVWCRLFHVCGDAGQARLCRL